MTDKLVQEILENPSKYFTRKQLFEMIKKVEPSKKKKETKKQKEVVDTDTLYVFTDGSSFNNGKKNCKGGYGIFFGDSDPRNVSQKIEGKVTNNIAELKAICECLKKLDSKKYKIVTDSMYSINCVTKWYKNWIKNDWKTSAGKPVQNKELIKDIVKLLKEKNVEFHHVNSHSPEPMEKDTFLYFLWYGNKMADELATGCNQ